LIILIILGEEYNWYRRQMFEIVGGRDIEQRLLGVLTRRDDERKML
jgi:hypothetical protein